MCTITGIRIGRSLRVTGIKRPGLARAQGVSVQYISYGFIAYDRSLSVLLTFLVGVKLE